MTIQTLRTRLMKQRKFRQLLFGSIFFSIALGMLIVPVERAAEGSQIHSLEDGLWWSIQTLTTVGYGDVVPVTSLGRIIGVAMQIIGTVMFGSLIALISSSMGRRQEEFYWAKLFERLDGMESKITEIEKHSGYLVTHSTPD